MTLQTQLVLRVLIEDPAQRRYGLELCELSGLASGTVYPILARLEQAGWLESEWEDASVPRDSGRPRRRFYGLTPDGVQLSREALVRQAAAQRRSRFAWTAPWSGTAAGAS
jgi:PadR family transcriptional regulator